MLERSVRGTGSVVAGARGPCAVAAAPRSPAAPRLSAMAAARSAELGIPMVRAAATGISAFVDARGVVTQRSNAFEKKTLVAEVRPLRVPTFYGAVGDWFAWSATVVAILMLALGFFQSRKT